MRTLQAIVVMLCIGPLANSPGLASSYDGSRNDNQATTAAASLPGLVPAGSTAASAVRAIKVAWDCPPGYVAGRYYRSCVPDRLLPHPTSTPSAEQLPSAVQRKTSTCSEAGLMPGGDAGAVNGEKCLSSEVPLSDRQRVRTFLHRRLLRGNGTDMSGARQ